MKRVIVLWLFLGFMAIGKSSWGQMKIFYYYPTQNVYYSTQNKSYLFQGNGQWCAAKSLPDSLRLDKQDKESRICIGSGTADILRDSSWHKEIARDRENRNKSGIDTTHYMLKVDGDRK